MIAENAVTVHLDAVDKPKSQGKSASSQMQFTDSKSEVGAIPEAALINRAKQGDIEAFAQLVGRHTEKVFCIALRITNSHEDAEDVVQDTFLKVFTNLDGFEMRSRFSTWLTRIAINTALMKLRSRLRHKAVSISENEQIESGTIPEQVVDWSPNPEQLYSRRELREILTSTLDSLPPHYRTIFVLRDVEGLSTAETADVLGISITAVKARLLRARLQLRERLNRYFQCNGGTAGADAALQVMVGRDREGHRFRPQINLRPRKANSPEISSCLGTDYASQLTV